MLVVLYLLEYMIMSLFGGVFILSAVVAALVGMYVLITNARILGLIFRERQDELNWF